MPFCWFRHEMDHVDMLNCPFLRNNGQLNCKWKIMYMHFDEIERFPQLRVGLGLITSKCILWSRFEPQHDKTNKMAYAPSEDSDQPGYPPSLIRVFAVRMKKAWTLSYTFSTQRKLIRLGGCPGWSESSLRAYVISMVLSLGGSYRQDFVRNEQRYYVMLVEVNRVW